MIERLLHYRDGPGYGYLWELIQSDLDPNTPPEVVHRAIWPRILHLRHDNRLSIQEAERIIVDYMYLMAGRLPYDQDEEEQWRMEDEEEEAEEERLQALGRENWNECAMWVAEERERLVQSVPDALGRIWRGTKIVVGTAAVLGLATALFSRKSDDRRDR